MKMPRSQRITIEQIKEASQEIRRSRKRSRPHRKLIKIKYIFQEDKSALLEEAPVQKKTPAQSNINKGDAFLICHTHSLIYSASLVENNSCNSPMKKEGRRAQVD
jgi:hypothetical protein